MSLTRIAVIVAHVIFAVIFALFAGLSVSVVGLTTFWIGAFVGGLLYFVFVIAMLMMMDRWGGDDRME